MKNQNRNVLPYALPDSDININMALLTLILKFLPSSPRGLPNLNNDRLLILIYLLKNPIILVGVLDQIGKREINLSDRESFSITSIAVNLDPLFDRNWIKSLLQRLSARQMVATAYRKSEGFVYQLTPSGHAVAEKLNGDYFDRIKAYLRNLEKLKGESTANLNKLLNNTFRVRQ
jgi:hypothetical protein